MTTIDFNATAALYLGADRQTALSEGARTFPSAAKAIRFAMEEVPPVSLRGAELVVEGKSYSRNDLRDLYDDAKYPLDRKAETRAFDEPVEA